MNRFNEETAAEIGRKPSERVYTCKGCDAETTEELVKVSGWGFLGCPSCVVDCAEQDAEELLLTLQAAECVVCGSDRKSLVSDRLVLGTLDSSCCGEVA